MSFATDDKEIYEKYDKIWNVVKSLLKLKFTAGPIRDDKYILAKLKIFKKKNLTTFNNNKLVRFIDSEIIGDDSNDDGYDSDNENDF